MNATIRTFRAPDPRAALTAVKAALGDDAIILGTREISGGLWGKREVEITVGVPEAPTAPAHQRSTVDSDVAALRRTVEELRAELSGTRAEPRGTRPDGCPAHALGLARRLLRQGVETSIAEEIVRLAVRDAPTTREVDLEEPTRAIVRKRLPPARAPWEPLDKGEPRRVLALVGGTGVGKTTTIAKIAARAVLDSRLKVSLVTVDSYRIGASEHIARYGEIMGVPTHVARDAGALREALARSSSADLVLIDTAGRSEPAAMASQMDLLRTVPGLVLHLVLAASAGGRELRVAARRYERFGIGRLIFSKLDEAAGPGSVLSAAAILPCPISCITDGQRVPDDIHAVSGPQLVDIVVGR